MGSVGRRVTSKLRQVQGKRAGKKAMSEGRNIVITGLGRSGTTLTCHLLNKLPDTIALSEPISPGKFAHLLPDHDAVVEGIEGFYNRQRRMARKRGLVTTKHVGGVVPDNTKGVVDGVRQRIAEKGKIEVDKELSPEFYLAIKDVGMFKALLPALAKRFPCFTIIRNPLAVRASSLSVKSKKKQRTNPPALVRYDTGLDRQLKGVKEEGGDAVDRWVMQMHLTFERYLQELPRENIIRYEDICDSRGKALSVIVPAAGELDEPLENKNLNPLYAGHGEKILLYGERLLASEGAYWEFYSKESVEELLHGLTS